MTFEEYQEKALKTKLYPQDIALLYLALGLNGEAGEVGEKIKKIYRDYGGHLSDDMKEAICKEMGDVLWYYVALCEEIGFTIEEIMKKNLEKLQDRVNRGVIKGSGDLR